MRWNSSAQAVGGVHVDGLEGLVDAEDDGEADGGLGSGEHDDEDREYLPVVPRPAVAAEGDVVDVGRVEDELDPHQDPEGIAASDDAEQAQAEDDGAQHHEMRDRESLHQPLISLRETVTAPMSATRRTRDAISNGRPKSVRKELPNT